MSEWINVKDRLPGCDEVVDIWCKVSGRHTDYKYIRSYNGKKGNDFFEVQFAGKSCPRITDSYDPVTHWKPLPDPPEE